MIADRDYPALVRAWVQDPRLVLLDTETTGLREDDEILEVAAVAGDGTVLVDTYVKPARKAAWPEAQAVNGISPAMVATAPGWGQVWPGLAEALTGKLLVIYNADYDLRMLAQASAAAGVAHSEPWAGTGCAMLAGAVFVGDWRDDRQSWRWQKLGALAQRLGLPATPHRALGDTLGTLAILRELAAREWWIERETQEARP